MHPQHDDKADSRDGHVGHKAVFGNVMSRRAFLQLAVVGAAGVVVGGTASAVYSFGIESIAAELRGLREPVRVAWLCDLHYGPFIHAGSVAAWVDATLELEPDLILLGGDIVDHRAPPNLAPLFDELGRLRSPLGTYAIRGNHEYARFGDPRPFEAALERSGVRTLVNQGVDVREDLYLAGFDSGRVGLRVIRNTLAHRPADSACLAAAHKPDVLPRMPPEIGLTLCGHTHGGQILLPGIGPIVALTDAGRDAASGWVWSPGLGYVSRGLGVVHVPIRLNCPAELTIVTLTPA